MNRITKLTIICISLILFACGGKENTDSQKDIYGKWQSSDKSLILEISKGGKIHSIHESKNFKDETKADLIFIDDTHIVGVWETSVQIWSVHIYGDKMTLTSEDAEKLKMTRIK